MKFEIPEIMITKFGVEDVITARDIFLAKEAVFVEKNPNSNYLADSRRAVIRKYMSIEDIIAEYHNDLKDEHIKILKD